MGYNDRRRFLLAMGLKAARTRAGFAVDSAVWLLTEAGVRCSLRRLAAWECGSGAASSEPCCSDLPILANVYGCQVNDFYMYADVDQSAAGPRAGTARQSFDN
jgi:hypothetical protein